MDNTIKFRMSIETGLIKELEKGTNGVTMDDYRAMSRDERKKFVIRHGRKYAPKLISLDCGKNPKVKK